MWTKSMQKVAASQCSKRKHEKSEFIFFHAACNKNAGWRKHSSYSASLHLSALILSCCQSQEQSHAKRSAHGHLPQTYKHGLTQWTYLTDWLFSVIFSHESLHHSLLLVFKYMMLEARLRGFCSLIFQLDWTRLSGL